MSTSPAPSAREVAVRADELAAAALRELPEAFIVAFDADLRVAVHAGRPLARARGSDSPIGAGEGLEAVFPPGLWPELAPLFRSALQGETRTREVWSAAGERCLVVNVGPLWLGRRPGGELAGGVAVVLDATDRARAGLQAGVGARADAFEQVFERAPIGTALLDPQWRWLLANRALCEITGFTSEELIGRGFEEVVPVADEAGEARLRGELLAGEVPALQQERAYVNAAGERLSAIVSLSLVRDATGQPLHYIAQLQDISERKQLEEHLRHLADHDPLTGLRNRRLFDHDLALQVARSRRYGEVAALVLLDLDSFKHINDEHGHGTGDDALKAVARALCARLRGTDLVARLGGDEFAVLLPHIDEDGLAVVAEGLRRVIGACAVEVEDAVLHPSASVGCALIDERSASPGEVYERADRAMYEAKRARREHPR